MPRLWIDTNIHSDIASGTTSSVTLMTGVSSTQTRFDQMMLLRTIIGLDIFPVVHDEGEGSQHLALGIGIASQEAFSAGVFLDPQTSTDYPTRGWVWKAQYRIWGFAADQPAVFNQRVDRDIRAMRKLENGEAYLTMFSNALEGVQIAIKVIGLVRQLWLVG